MVKQCSCYPVQLTRQGAKWLDMRLHELYWYSLQDVPFFFRTVHPSFEMNMSCSSRDYYY